MHISNKFFPYPVLNSDSDLTGYNAATAFSVSCATDYDDIRLRYEIKATVSVHSEYFNKLINDNLISLYALVECSYTMFRKPFKLDFQKTNIIKIKASDLRGRCEICFIVCANKSLNYSSPEFLEDYSGLSFPVEKNMIIGLDNGLDLLADNSDEVKNIESIFIIHKDENCKNACFDYNKSKIIIKLPKEEYQKYDRLKKIKKIEPVFLSSIALPALLWALSQIDKESGYTYWLIEYSWLQSFDVAYTNKTGIKVDDETFQTLNLYEACQIVFDNPLNNTFLAIQNIILDDKDANND